MKRFQNRTDAGKQLAAAFSHYLSKSGVVYGLPRGGVVVAYEIAKALAWPLDLIIVQKIGHPLNEEYALCAIAEDGEALCEERGTYSSTESFLEGAEGAARQEVRRRRELYFHTRSHKSPTGTIALIVDDGLATGLTMRAAVAYIKQQAPAQVVVAVPVGPHDTIARLRHEVDEVVVIHDDHVFKGSVGAYYDEFDQVSHEEVIALFDEVQP